MPGKLNPSPPHIHCRAWRFVIAIDSALSSKRILQFGNLVMLMKILESKSSRYILHKRERLRLFILRAIFENFIITSYIKAHHIAATYIIMSYDSYERRIFRLINILAAWIALSLPLEILNFPFEDLPKSIFFTNFSFASTCFVANSLELDISLSFLWCIDMFASSNAIMSAWSSNLQFMFNGYWILVAVLSKTRTLKFEFPWYLKTRR